jgi:hypothetical protein
VYRDLPANLVSQILPMERRPGAEDLELLRNVEAIADPQVRACLGGFVKSVSGRKRRKGR